MSSNEFCVIGYSQVSKYSSFQAVNKLITIYGKDFKSTDLKASELTFVEKETNWIAVDYRLLNLIAWFEKNFSYVSYWNQILNHFLQKQNCTYGVYQLPHSSYCTGYIGGKYCPQIQNAFLAFTSLAESELHPEEFNIYLRFKKSVDLSAQEGLLQVILWTKNT